MFRRARPGFAPAPRQCGTQSRLCATICSLLAGRPPKSHTAGARSRKRRRGPLCGYEGWRVPLATLHQPASGAAVGFLRRGSHCKTGARLPNAHATVLPARHQLPEAVRAETSESASLAALLCSSWPCVWSSSACLLPFLFVCLIALIAVLYIVQ